MEFTSGEEWVSSAEDERPALFPQGVRVSADICGEIITKSKTVSKGLLRYVQTDAETVSSFVSRNILTPEQGDQLRKETSPMSERLYDILRPALLRGGNSALQRFYWCLRDTQDDGRLGHKQLADAIKKRVDKYIEREKRRKISGKRSLEPAVATIQSPSQVSTGVGVSGTNTRTTTTSSYHHLPKHRGIIAGERLPSDVEVDATFHPLSKQKGILQQNLNPSSDQQLHNPQQSLGASNLKTNDVVLSDDQSSCQGDIESQSEVSFSGRIHVPSKKKSSAVQLSHAVNLGSSSEDEAQFPLGRSLLSSSQKESFKTFKQSRGSVLSGLREAILGTPGARREDGLSRASVSKLLFPDVDPSVILSSPDVMNLSRSGGVLTTAIVDLWVAKCLLTHNDLYDISLALLSQPFLGKHLKCIADWIGFYEANDPLIQAFSKGLGHSWPIFAEKIGFTKSDLKKPNSTKVSKKWFFASVWKLPLFERPEGERLLTAALRMAGLDDELMNFANKLPKTSNIAENRAHTMSELKLDSEKLTQDTTTTDTETPTDTTGTDMETPRDIKVDTGVGTLPVPKLEATSGGERVKPSSETTISWRDSHDERNLPPWTDSSATLTPESATSYDSDVTLVGDEAYLYGDKYFESTECKIYDRNAILLGVDIVPPRIRRRSPLSGLYENMKAVPFDRELFETLLISSEEIISLTDENSRSALFLACELNNADAATLLLRFGANPDIQDDYGRTCLHLPGVYWNEPLLMSLLGPTSNINVNIDTFETHVTPLCVACSSKEYAAVKKLLDRGADPKGHPESLYPPLLIAAQNGSLDILRLLIESGANLEAENVDGYTVLHMAIFDSHQDVVELLLEKGCDVNHKAKNDCTPLNCAAADGHLSILKLLLDRGANPNSIRTFSRVTGLPLARISALADAALGCHIGVVQTLVYNNADVHFRSDDYLSVLGYACIGGSCDVVGFLMTETDCGKDIKQLALPLNSALTHENFKCAKLMLDLAGGKEVILPKIRHDAQFVKNVNTVYAIYGGSDVINFGDMVPKSVGRTDDSFQKYRTVHRLTVIGDVKIVELIKPDELPHYRDLVQYVANRHIFTTAELMHGSEGLRQKAASTGSNDIVDFVLDYQAGKIRPQDLVFRMNKANHGTQNFFHSLVDFVHLQEYARHFDNRIALQYFQDIQFKQEMGLPSGMGVEGVAPSSAFHSTFTSQDMKALQEMRGSGSIPGMSNVHGYGDLGGLAGGFNAPKRSVFEGVGRQVGYSSSDGVPFNLDITKKTSSDKVAETQLPPKGEKSQVGRQKGASKSPSPTNQPVQDDKRGDGSDRSTRKDQKPKASQELSEQTSVPISDGKAGRERSTIDKKLLTALSKSQLGSESGTEDDDQSTVVLESSKGEYDSSETPPAVSKEPISAPTEYPIDVTKNAHQALLDTISNDSAVVRVWMPLLRRLRPPLPERELDNIRKSSTGSQAKAAQALNMWARITQGPTVPTWNELADGLKRQKRHDLYEHIWQSIESQVEEPQVEEDPQQLLTPKILGDDKEEFVSQGDISTLSHSQTSGTDAHPQTSGTDSHPQTGCTGSHPRASGTDAIAHTTSISSNHSGLNPSSNVPIQNSNTPEVVPQIPSPVSSSSVLPDLSTNTGPAYSTSSLLDPSVPVPTSGVPVSICMEHCSPTIPLDSTFATVVASHDPITESTLTSDVVQESMGSFSESVLHTKPQSTPNIAIPDYRSKVDASQMKLSSQSFAETIPNVDSFLPIGDYSHSTSSFSQGAFGISSDDFTHIDSALTDDTGPRIVMESTNHPSAPTYQSGPVPVSTVPYFPGERNLLTQYTTQTESSWSVSGPANSTTLGPSETAHHIPWALHHMKHSQTADKTQTLYHERVHLPPVDLTNRGQKFMIREIGCKVKTKWPILSRFLGLDQGDIDEIKSRYSTAEEKGVRALEKWVSSQPWEATWNNLVLYLKRINRPDLCQVIYDYFSEFDNLDFLREKTLSSHMAIADLEDKEQFLRNVSIFLHTNSCSEKYCETLALHLNVSVSLEDSRTEDNAEKCYCVLQRWIHAEPCATIGMLSAVLREMDCEGDLLSLQYIN